MNPSILRGGMTTEGTPALSHMALDAEPGEREQKRPRRVPDCMPFRPIQELAAADAPVDALVERLEGSRIEVTGLLCGVVKASH